MAQLQKYMKDIMYKCFSGETMTALPAVMMAFEDEPTNENFPTHANNFAEKWNR